MDEENLPPFLLITECLETEQIPLQVALLTMELATLRLRLSALERHCDLAGPEPFTFPGGGGGGG
jgi:hypothetical protein